jgi:hypothetical protein
MQQHSYSSGSKDMEQPTTPTHRVPVDPPGLTLPYPWEYEEEEEEEEAPTQTARSAYLIVPREHSHQTLAMESIPEEGESGLSTSGSEGRHFSFAQPPQFDVLAGARSDQSSEEEQTVLEVPYQVPFPPRGSSRSEVQSRQCGSRESGSSLLSLGNPMMDGFSQELGFDLDEKARRREGKRRKRLMRALVSFGVICLLLVGVIVTVVLLLGGSEDTEEPMEVAATASTTTSQTLSPTLAPTFGFATIEQSSGNADGEHSFTVTNVTGVSSSGNDTTTQTNAPSNMDDDASIVGSSLGTVHLPQPENDVQGIFNPDNGINATFDYGTTQP